MATKLTDAERDKAVAGLPGWKYEAGAKALIRDFKFRDFSEAFGFMARVALLAQAANHHPDWSNSYNKVSVRLSTHDAGGVTANDAALAAAISKLVD
jgi:4a-hydroxytetrahydrobiopterin dehydratase